MILMFGFLLGTACLIGLVAVVRRGRHGPFGYRSRHRRHGLRGALHALLSRLDAAPGQEKVIVAAAEELLERARDAGRKVRETRRDLAQAVRGERVDEARLSEVFGRHDAAIGELRAGSVQALQKVHEALDERQRKILGDLIDSGGLYGFGWHGRGYGC
jgi:hypothetical protein